MKILTALLLTTTMTGVASAQTAPTRPAQPAQAAITWLYYKDLPRAMQFYEEVLGLPMVVDQGWAKVYQASRASDTKPVAVALVTEQVDAWYAWLVSKGVKMRSELRDSTSLPIRGFTAFDPEGYTLEFETFRDHPQNATMRALLKQ